MADAQLQLTNLVGGGNFIFQFFPQTVSVTDRNNWEPQDLSHGMKPLFYMNRDPRRIHFPELWFDNTHNNLSLRPTLEQLENLMEEVDSIGTPPPLLANWGDRSEFCVLEELEVEEQFYNPEGAAIRAKVSITLLKLQSGA